jgi:peptidoglycan DL-endopeptidase CwlO
LEYQPVTSPTEKTAIESGDKKRFNRASVVRNARRVGVIAVAAALATPLALPAFAASTSSSVEGDSYSALVAQDAQTVAGVVTAGEGTLSGARLEVSATTAEELQAIRAELEAAVQAEAQERAAAQQQQAAAARTNGAASSPAAASGAASAGVSGSAVADAALAQVGVSQDCTSLVRRSIAAVGLPYTGMGGLFNLGPTISQAQASPGDIIYYSNGGTGSAHVAIYIGGGRAVHGGWSGYNTVVAGVNIGGSAPVFIDIT